MPCLFPSFPVLPFPSLRSHAALDFSGSPFEDILFGRNPNAPRKGSDLQTEIDVSFMEAAVHGVERDIEVREGSTFLEAGCAGPPAVPRPTPPLPTHAHLQHLQLSFQTQDPRTGQISTERRSVTVQVPPGVSSGMNLRVAGQGGAGANGGPPGDMFVRVRVARDKYFERDENNDVHVEVPVSVGQAALGGTVDVRTVYGTVEMKIPAGVQPGAKLLMRGKGGVRLRGGRGGAGKADQVVHLKLEVPRGLTERQRALLKAFQDDVDGVAVDAVEMGEGGEKEDGDGDGDGDGYGEEPGEDKDKGGWFGR